MTAHGTPPHQTEFDAGAFAQTNTLANVPVPGAQYWPELQSASAPQRTRPRVHVRAQVASEVCTALQHSVPPVQSSAPSQENVAWLEASQLAEHCAWALAVVMQHFCPGNVQLSVPQ